MCFFILWFYILFYFKKKNETWSNVHVKLLRQMVTKNKKTALKPSIAFPVIGWHLSNRHLISVYTPLVLLLPSSIFTSPPQICSHRRPRFTAAATSIFNSILFSYSHTSLVFLSQFTSWYHPSLINELFN